MQPGDEEDEETIRRQNMTALVFVVVLTGLGLWLVSAFQDHVKLEECYESGRRKCLPQTDVNSQ